MKIYVLYIIGEYATAVHVSTDRDLCEQAKSKYQGEGWIEEYDFSKAKEFELE